MQKRMRVLMLLAFQLVFCLIIAESLAAFPILHNSDYLIKLVASGLCAATIIAIAPTGYIYKLIIKLRMSIKLALQLTIGITK